MTIVGPIRRGGALSGLCLHQQARYIPASQTRARHVHQISESTRAFIPIRGPRRRSRLRWLPAPRPVRPGPRVCRAAVVPQYGQDLCGRAKATQRRDLPAHLWQLTRAGFATRFSGDYSAKLRCPPAAVYLDGMRNVSRRRAHARDALTRRAAARVAWLASSSQCSIATAETYAGGALRGSHLGRSSKGCSAERLRGS